MSINPNNNIPQFTLATTTTTTRTRTWGNNAGTRLTIIQRNTQEIWQRNIPPSSTPQTPAPQNVNTPNINSLNLDELFPPERYGIFPTIIKR